MGLAFAFLPFGAARFRAAGFGVSDAALRTTLAVTPGQAHHLSLTATAALSLTYGP